MVTDRERADRLREAAAILQDCEKWDAVALYLRDEADELDPPKPAYEEGLYVATKYGYDDYWVLREGIWHGALWEATRTVDETDELIEWRGPLTRVRVLGNDEIPIPASVFGDMTAIEARQQASYYQPSSTAYKAHVAYAEALEAGDR